MLTKFDFIFTCFFSLSFEKILEQDMKPTLNYGHWFMTNLSLSRIFAYVKFFVIKLDVVTVVSNCQEWQMLRQEQKWQSIVGQVFGWNGIRSHDPFNWGSLQYWTKSDIQQWLIGQPILKSLRFHWVEGSMRIHVLHTTWFFSFPGVTSSASSCRRTCGSRQRTWNRPWSTRTRRRRSSSRPKSWRSCLRWFESRKKKMLCQKKKPNIYNFINVNKDVARKKWSFLLDFLQWINFLMLRLTCELFMFLKARVTRAIFTSNIAIKRHFFSQNIVVTFQNQLKYPRIEIFNSHDEKNGQYCNIA